MTDQAVAEMTLRRVESMKRRARQDIALSLLAANGSVTAEQIAEAFAAEWRDPDPQQLAAEIAAKANAAVEHCRLQLAAAERTVPGLEAKLDKLRRLVANTEADIEAARAAPAEASEALAYAESVAESANRMGDAAAAPAPSEHRVMAGAANAKGGK